jgi:hypothetical protein
MESKRVSHYLRIVPSREWWIFRRDWRNCLCSVLMSVRDGQSLGVSVSVSVKAKRLVYTVKCAGWATHCGHSPAAMLKGWWWHNSSRPTCFILGGPGARIGRLCGPLKVTDLLLCLVTNCCIISDFLDRLRDLRFWQRCLSSRLGCDAVSIGKLVANPRGVIAQKTWIFLSVVANILYIKCLISKEGGTKCVMSGWCL